MSLINEMLSDLEARKGGAMRHVDSALDGLRAAGSLGERSSSEFVRLGLGGLVLIAALVTLWNSRDLLSALVPARGPSVPATDTPLVIREAPRQSVVQPITAPVPEPVIRDAAPSPSESPTLVQLEPPPPVMAPTVAPAVSEPPSTVLPAPPASRSPPVVAEQALPPTLLEPEFREPAHGTPEPRVTQNSSTVEYPGSFHRERSTTPAQTPEASRYAQVQAMFADGQRGAGIAALRNFVLTYPMREDARTQLALELIGQRRNTEAEAVLRAGLRQNPQATALARPLGHLLLEQGDARSALEVLRPATPAIAGNAEYHGLLAAAEQRSGAHGLAITRYRGLLKEQPLNGSWLVGLAISLTAVGEEADAIANFARALDDRSLAEPLRAFATRELVRLKDRQRP